MSKQEKELNFEKAFTRLEEILEKMNSGKTDLDESITLYEEADTLIHTCHNRLSDAERKIEMLTKKRNGEILADENQKPLVEEFAFKGP